MILVQRRGLSEMPETFFSSHFDELIATATNAAAVMQFLFLAFRLSFFSLHLFASILFSDRKEEIVFIFMHGTCLRSSHDIAIFAKGKHNTRKISRMQQWNWMYKHIFTYTHWTRMTEWRKEMKIFRAEECEAREPWLNCQWTTKINQNY